MKEEEHGPPVRIWEGAWSDGEPLRLRVHGADDRPVLVYLPGIHGDWTLVGGLRAALGAEVRFVECTYPRTREWTLADHAREIVAVLNRAGIRRGWVLGESFGSQIAWPLTTEVDGFQVEGVILAGGFGRYPMIPVARAGARIVPRLPLKWFNDPLRLYAWVARWRFRHSPDLAASIAEFVQRRTDPDRHAAVHRMRLISGHDPSPLAGRLAAPVYYLTGLLDPVVPWFLVVPWLKRYCPAFRGWRLVAKADHNVLASGTAAASRAILGWMQTGTPSGRPC